MHAAAECRQIPMQVVRQPRSKLEVAGPGGAVTPGRWNLGQLAAGQRCLDGQLECQLESGAALDGHVVEKAPRVELEVAGRVVDRDGGKSVQRKPRGPAQGALEPRPTHLTSTADIPARGDDIGTGAS